MMRASKHCAFTDDLRLVAFIGIEKENWPGVSSHYKLSRMFFPNSSGTWEILFITNLVWKQTFLRKWVMYPHSPKSLWLTKAGALIQQFVFTSTIFTVYKCRLSKTAPLLVKVTTLSCKSLIKSLTLMLHTSLSCLLLMDVYLPKIEVHPNDWKQFIYFIAVGGNGMFNLLETSPGNIFSSLICPSGVYSSIRWEILMWGLVDLSVFYFQCISALAYITTICHLISCICIGVLLYMHKEQLFSM